jgi:hypothetical protein
MGENPFDGKDLCPGGECLTKLGRRRTWFKKKQAGEPDGSGKSGYGRTRIPGRCGDHALGACFESQGCNEGGSSIFEGARGIAPLKFEVEVVETKARANAAGRHQRRVTFSKKGYRGGDRHERTVPINPFATRDILEAKDGLIGVHGLENAFTTGTAAQGAK